MNQAFNAVDLAICAALLVGTVAVGLWFGRRARTSEGLLLANRGLGWAWLAPSLGLAGLTAFVIGSAPLDGYPAAVGLRLLMLPMGLCAAVPVALLVAVPLYRRLDVDSVDEYLELRFDVRTRAVASALQVLLQLVWLAGLLALPARFMALAGLPAWLLIIALGAAATVCAAFGGLRGATATAVGQSLLAVAAVAILIAVVSPLGYARAWPETVASGRATVFDAQSPVSTAWSAWPGALFAFLAALYFFVSDQATVQRVLAAQGPYDAPYGILAGGLIAGLAMTLAVFAGVGMFVAYHKSAEGDLPPQWFAHFATDPSTGRPLGDADTVIDRSTIDDLIRRGALLDPNTGRPITSIHADKWGIDYDRLATRLTPQRGGERILRAGQDRLVGRFVERHVRTGVRGVVLAGVAAAAAGAVAVGLLAIATLVLIDFHRRFGWAEGWLARRVGKATQELDQADELRFVRLTVLLAGAAVTLWALALTFVGDLPGWLLRGLGTLAGPMLGVFLLGLFTRRTTAAGAVVGLVTGMAAAAFVALCGPLSEATGLPLCWPWPAPPGATWPMTIGTCAGLIAGYLASWAVGGKRSRRELAGLVVGVGALGVLRPTDEPHAALAKLEQQAKVPPKKNPWR